jgi:hypothetical protein
MSKEELPDKIRLDGYGLTMEFILTDKRQIDYYGKTNTTNESLWRTDKLKDNEVFYQTIFGWGVFVDVNKMETVSYDGTEWGGQKIKPKNMRKIKYVLIKINEEDSDMLNGIPKENIIQEQVVDEEDDKKYGHPILYNP